MTDLRRLKQVIAECLAEVAAEYETEVNRVIESENEFADLGFVSQDIVDTGRLKNSLVVETRAGEGDLVSEISFSWEPRSTENNYPYAPAVWMGFFAFGGPKFIPGRHWDTRAAKNIQIVRRFGDRLTRKGIKVVGIVDNTSSLP